MTRPGRHRRMLLTAACGAVVAVGVGPAHSTGLAPLDRAMRTTVGAYLEPAGARAPAAVDGALAASASSSSGLATVLGLGCLGTGGVLIGLTRQQFSVRLGRSGRPRRAR